MTRERRKELNALRTARRNEVVKISKKYFKTRKDGVSGFLIATHKSNTSDYGLAGLISVGYDDVYMGVTYADGYDYEGPLYKHEWQYNGDVKGLEAFMRKVLRESKKHFAASVKRHKSPFPYMTRL